MSNSNCGDAYNQIQPFFNSINTNNQVRQEMTATYGCFASISVFKLVFDLISFSGDLSGSGFWEFLVQEFPSVSSPVDDKIPYMAELGTDADMSMLYPGIVLLPSDTINSTTYNPGSLLVQDRIPDANSYLTFLSMSLIGSLLNRNGNPYPNHKKGNALPWTNTTNVVGDGCAVASAVLNLSDSISYIAAAASANAGAKYSAIQSLLGTGLNAGCSAGCTLCGLTCTACPTSLRNRSACASGVSDVNTCAAVGIDQFIDLSWTLGP